MDTGQLMVGDYILVDNEVCRVDAIFYKGVISYQGNDVCGNTDNPQPIPITPEILKKIGFGYVENDINPYNDEVLSHFYLGEEGYCANMDILIGTYNNGIFWFSSPKASLNGIRYVHELQHLYKLSGFCDKEIKL